MPLKTFPRLFLFAALAALASFGNVAAETAYTPPPTEAGQDGWMTYVDPLMLDSSSVSDLSPSPDTPEGAVVLFLASRIRGDTAWQAAITSDPDRRTEKGLKRWDEMALHRAQIKERKMRGEDRAYVRVWLELSVAGDAASGIDDFTVIREAGGWRITDLPS